MANSFCSTRDTRRVTVEKSDESQERGRNAETVTVTNGTYRYFYIGVMSLLSF